MKKEYKLRGWTIERAEKASKKMTVHGMVGTRPYTIWNNMKARCSNPNDDRYSDYGGRGIKFDSRWDKFEEFWKDMKQNYSDVLSLDRIDVNGNYSKENCRWATRKEQQRNRRRNALVLYKGESKCVSEWAEELKIDVSTLSKRLSRGWSVEKAMKEKPKVRKKD